MAKLIGLLGGPCTGKTTLAEAVHMALTNAGVSSSWADEFVSEDIKQIGAPDPELIVYEQYRFLFQQRRREEQSLANSDIVVTDAPSLLGYAYPLLRCSPTKGERQEKFLPEFTRLFNEDVNRYDHLYLLKREINYEENGIRFHTYEQAVAFDNMLINMLNDAGANYTIIGGSVEERVSKVLGDLGINKVMAFKQL